MKYMRGMERLEKSWIIPSHSLVTCRLIVGEGDGMGAGG